MSSPQPEEHDLTLSDTEQTLAETDQTSSDSDQTAADTDQDASGTDQDAADQDQEASDRDLAHGGDRAIHDASRDMRDEGARKRRSGTERRCEAAVTRDSVAKARDLAAEARDQAADNLDRHLEEREASLGTGSTSNGGTPSGDGAVENRDRAAEDRASAAKARLRAGVDRAQAATDRKQAARERLQAESDRNALLQELEATELDSLTGARARGPGLVDLDHEIDRARRTTGLLAIAYVDVVGLKVVNDTHGHSAGDALLKDAVQAIRDHLRSYDAIVRLGGDEFLCVMSGAPIDSARQRFEAIQAALAASSKPSEIKVGVASLGPTDSATALIDRADAALPLKRHTPTGNGNAP